MKKKDFLIQLIPFFAQVFLTAVTLIVYSLAFENRTAVIYAEICVGMLLPLILPILGLITKKPFPVALSALITMQTFLAIDLGAACRFYGLISWWDLLLHGLFGFLCCFFVAFFLIRWNGTNMSVFGQLVMIALAALGIAALWEIWEYLCDLMFHNDPQRVWSAVASGANPMTDTMTDILIAFAGVLLFYAVLLVDKFLDHKFMRRFYLTAKGTGASPAPEQTEANAVQPQSGDDADSGVQ